MPAQAIAALASRPHEARHERCVYECACAVRQGEKATAAEGDLRTHDLRGC